jgi:hypothetical protein
VLPVRPAAGTDPHPNGSRWLLLSDVLPGVRAEVGAVARMKLHPLSPEVKCLTCGGVLVYVRVRTFGDLYRCALAAKVCHGDVLYYCKAGSTTCGWAQVPSIGFPGRWTECAGQRPGKGQ